MPKQKRIIRRSAGSKGRKPGAAESGKRAALGRHGRSKANDGESTLVIEGSYSPSERREMFALLEAEGLRESRRDPSKTIDLIEEDKGRITVYVSDNHLALALGKKLHAARKGGELTITWSHDDMPVRVHWMKRKT